MYYMYINYINVHVRTCTFMYSTCIIHVYIYIYMYKCTCFFIYKIKLAFQHWVICMLHVYVYTVYIYFPEGLSSTVAQHCEQFALNI